MLRTPICDLLGIEKPVFQGGMAWIADASLAAAVSEAGGLGIIAAMNANADWLRDQIHELREKTDKPFGVNVMLMSPFADEVAQVVIDEHVPVVVTGAGNPTKYMKAWNEAGIKVIPVVASVAMAKLVQRAGAVAVVAEGTESGGHIGETTTMALVPQVVDAVKIPVIAAGGIADGRGVAAAFMLGAVGVQVGTRFLVANECTVAETSDGRLVLNMRNPGTFRMLACSEDGGQTWSKSEENRDLIDPVCQGSMLNALVDGEHMLYFSNAASSTRDHMTVKKSSDNGKNWDTGILIYDGPSAYSDIVELNEHEIAILYENGVQNPYQKISFKIIKK